MKRFNSTVSIFLVAFSANPASGQSETGALLKAGLFPYINQHEFKAIAAHLEFEGAFRRSPFLTSGPRLDYIKVFDAGYSLMIGYDLKLYPLYKKSRGPITVPLSASKPVIFRVEWAATILPITDNILDHLWAISISSIINCHFPLRQACPSCETQVPIHTCLRISV